jgi:hypothetical protein
VLGPGRFGAGGRGGTCRQVLGRRFLVHA